MTKFTLTLFLMSFFGGLYAQNSISGTIKDNTGSPLIGATVYEPSSGRGTIANLEGVFEFSVAQLPTTIEVSFIGYKTQALEISTSKIDVVLSENTNNLDQVVIVGTRGKSRTVITSPVPIDNINASELISSGQSSVDQMINYRVPSYNSTNQTISDATAHFDPSELRNLGPSRTLVLVNGKRKNQSALVYVNDTPGKGEVGVDMKSIPVSAIERIEVLRDGASAQYGSDAIAGVINIILKERPSPFSVNIGSGITTEGDGLTYNADINKGFLVGKNGYLNLTGSYYHQDYTDRAGEPGRDDLFGVDATNEFIQANPDLGMTVGQPEYDKYSAAANFGMPYNDGLGKFYITGSYTLREGKSFALYRTPYWIPSDFGLLTPAGETYDGFQPTFETTINDNLLTIGNEYRIGNWDTDISLTTGRNSVDYLIANSINPSLGAASPTEFDAGNYAFGNILGNLDISRSFEDVTLAFGVEARQENFTVGAGQEESYINGGVQSFPGLQPSNALEADRTNVGAYASVDWDINDDFLLGGAARFENYSDFGTNLSWKLNTRYLIADQQGAIRASVSTGFRAPSLHQVYLSNIQTLVSGGTVSNQGTFNNVSTVIKGLGIDPLDAETSFNISAGLTYRLTDNFSFSLDYYSISLDNRVLFTGEIGFDGNDLEDNPVEVILKDFDVTSIKFFVNAMDTKTQGIDLVANYNNIALGTSSKLDFVFAFNYNKTEIDGTITAPKVLADAGYDIFNRKEQSRVTTARPNLKFLFGANATFGKFNATLNNTYFGEVTWQHASDKTKDQTFGAKVITDLILGYTISDKFGLNLTVNNLLNVYPDVIDTKGDVVTDLGGRFRYPWEVNQFGFNGTSVKLGLNFQF